MLNWKKLFKKRIDPKDIPVLKDVIEDDEFVDKDELVEDYPHLFLNEDDNNVVVLSSAAEQTDSPENNAATIEIDSTEAGSIESETEDNSLEVDTAETGDDETENTETGKTGLNLTDPVQLDAIVNKIVEQLMPDLEQQLHSLVQKTLAEKSPEELASLFNNNDNHSSGKS